MYIFLVVKGSDADVVRQARERNIQLEIVGRGAKNAEVYCRAPIETLRAVIHWYAEDCGTTAPFENGSCLWYARKE